MLSYNQRLDVEKSVRDLLSQNTMFTAWDITRRTGLPHADVRLVVHQMYDNSQFLNYTRTLLTLGNGKTPFVYHLIGGDPNTYKSQVSRGFRALPPPPSLPIPVMNVIPGNPTVQNQATSAMVVQAHLTTPNQSVTTPNGLIKNVDAHGRIRLTKGLITQAGFQVGTTVVAKINKVSGKISLRTSFNSAPGSDEVRKLYHVDSKKNVRVSLRSAGVTKSRYLIHVNGPEIELDPQ